MDKKDKGKSKLIHSPKVKKSNSSMSISSNEDSEKFMGQAIRARISHSSRKLPIDIAEIQQFSQQYTPVSRMINPLKVPKGIEKFTQNPSVNFGNYSLQKCFESSKKFRPMIGFDLTEKQQVLLDNLWHIQTLPNSTAFKVLVLNALCFYFQEQSSKVPERINKPRFTHYVIFRGTKIGVFNKWETVSKFIQCSAPIYKGFSSFAEAIKIAREQFGTHSFYIEPEEVKTFSDMVKEKPEQVIQSQEEAISTLQQQLEQKEAQLSKVQAENTFINQKLGFLEAKNKQISQKQKSPEKPIDSEEISFDAFKARMLDRPWRQTLKPVLNQFPEFEQIVSEKVCKEFPLQIYSLQQKLLEIAFEEAKYTGVKIVEKILEENHEEIGTGLLLLQVQLPTNLPDDLIVQLYHFGMIDLIIFKLNPQTEQLLEKFGEKFTLVVGNMATHSHHQPSELFCKIFASLPEMGSHTYRPPRKRIFVTDRKVHRNSWFANASNRSIINFSQLIGTQDQEVFAKEQIKKLQRTPKIPFIYEWQQFKLLAEGHYIQIWTDSFWSMLLPFSGEGDELTIDHIRNDEEGFTDSNSDPGSPDTIASTHRDF